MTDVRSMVDNVIAATRLYLRFCAPEVREHELISCLDIIDHGNPDGIQIGHDWVSMANLERFRPELERLRGRFEQNGFVHIQHYRPNLQLLRVLARIWQVRVYAGTGKEHGPYHANRGDYVYCEPGDVDDQPCVIGISGP